MSKAALVSATTSSTVIQLSATLATQYPTGRSPEAHAKLCPRISW